MSTNDTKLVLLNSTGNNNHSSTTTVDAQRAALYHIGVPILLLFCAVSMFTNCYILAAVRFLAKQQLKPQVQFTISLCASNVAMCLTMVSSLLTQSYLPLFDVKLPSPICVGLIHEAVRMGLMLTVVLHLLALAINQYWGIVRPLQYPIHVTAERVRAVIFTLWLAPPVSLLIYFCSVPDQAFRSPECRNIHFFFRFGFRLVISLCFFVPLFLLTLVYITILMIIRRNKFESARLRHRRSQQQQRQQQQHRFNSSRTSAKTLITPALYVLSFAFGWLPLVVMFSMYCESGCVITRAMYARHMHLFIKLNMLCTVLTILKPLADAFIYAARNDELRLAIYLMQAHLCPAWFATNMLQRIDQERLNVSASRHYQVVSGHARESWRDTRRSTTVAMYSKNQTVPQNNNACARWSTAHENHHPTHRSTSLTVHFSQPQNANNKMLSPKDSDNRSNSSASFGSAILVENTAIEYRTSGSSVVSKTSKTSTRLENSVNSTDFPTTTTTPTTHTQVHRASVRSARSCTVSFSPTLEHVQEQQLLPSPVTPTSDLMVHHNDSNNQVVVYSRRTSIGDTECHQNSNDSPQSYQEYIAML